MGSSHRIDATCTYPDMGVDEMIFQEFFSKTKEFFQKDFFQKNFSTQLSFPEKFFNNFLLFQEAINKLMVGDEMYEKAKEDQRQKYQDYPSA
jgi:hypothetical protein